MAAARPDFVFIARSNLYQAVYHDGRESHTNSFWQFENEQLFPLPQGFLCQQKKVFPDHGNMRFDRTVSRMTPDGRPMTKVVAGEDKRLGAATGDVGEAENDVQRKPVLLMQKDGLDHIYCHTTFGTMFRTWIIHLATERLEPLFGPNTKADKSAYIDFRTSFGQYEWHRLGSFVKNEEVRPLAEFEALDYLQPPYECQHAGSE